MFIFVIEGYFDFVMILATICRYEVNFVKFTPPGHHKIRPLR